MKHVTMVERFEDGHLGRCESCGERNDTFTGYGEAVAWCDEHEHSPRKGQRGAKPGLKALERLYRERSENLVYTPEERAQWVVLADELAERLKVKGQVIEGQMSLLDELGEGEET